MSAVIEHSGLARAHDERLLDRVAAQAHGVVAAFGQAGPDHARHPEQPEQVAPRLAGWHGPAANTFAAADKHQHQRIGELHGEVGERRSAVAAADQGHRDDHRKAQNALHAWQEADKEIEPSTPWGRRAKRDIAHHAASTVLHHGRAAHHRAKQTAHHIKGLGKKFAKRAAELLSRGGNPVEIAQQLLGRNAADLEKAGILRPGVPIDKCCANFVTTVLRHSGLINWHSDAVADVGHRLAAEGWHTTKNPPPGAVAIINGSQHIELVASNHGGGHIGLIGSNNVNRDDSQRVTYSNPYGNVTYWVPGRRMRA